MYAKYAKLRDEKNMTDYEVAKKADIPTSTLYDWKQRAQKDKNAAMSIENLSKILRVLETTLDKFMEG